MSIKEKSYTVDDLWELSHADVERDVPERYELDEGELIVMAPTGKFYSIAPDFAVEVVSPSDTAQQMRRKADQYLQAGTRLIWVVYPDERLVDVFQPGHDMHTFRGQDVLEGGDVLPGFSIAVSDLFIRLRS